MTPASAPASSPRKVSPLLIVAGLLVLAGLIAAVYFLVVRLNDPDAGMTISATGLKYKELVVGSGPAAKAGDTAVVHYTATLPGGKKIFSTLDQNKPYEYQVGSKNVLPGWDEGVTGMKVGGKRKVVVPPALAFGKYGATEIIGPNDTVVYEVELLALK